MARKRAKGETKTAVVAAIAGNLLIALVKFAAALFSGSAAMLSEGIHSLVDTVNDGVLLYGLNRSLRPADERHPFGYGHEAYFWTLIAGVLFFTLGGGVSIVTGIQRITGASTPHHTGWNYAVLAAASLFEGVSWVFGYRAFRSEQRGRGILETIHLTKDPMSFAVLLEDTAALIGLALAFAGVYAAERLGAAWADGAASVAIGVLLCAVALIMVYESKGLLIGEGMAREKLDLVRSLAQAQPAVERVQGIATLYLGPDEVVLAIDLRFCAGTTVETIRDSLTELRHAVNGRYPEVKRLFIETTPIEDIAKSAS